MSAMSWIRGFNATVGRLAPDLAASKMHRAFLTPRELPPRDWELPLLAEAERVTLRFGLSALRWAMGSTPVSRTRRWSSCSMRTCARPMSG